MITKLEFRDTNKWVIVYTKFFFLSFKFFFGYINNWGREI